MQAIIKIKGLEQLNGKIQQMKAIVSPENMVKTLTQQGLLMAGYCKKECPVVTGRLRASIGTPSSNGIFKVTPLSVTLGTSVHYAFDVEFGTKPHIIKPKTKKILAWPTGAVAQKVSISSGGIKRGGLQYRTNSGKLTSSSKKQGYMFAKSVKHPGFKGRHFMRNGVINSIPHVTDNLAKTYAGAFAKL
jgi:hypothetical protein